LKISKYCFAVFALAAASMASQPPVCAQGFVKLHVPGGATSKENIFDMARPSSRVIEQPIIKSALLTRPRVCLVLGGGGTRGAAHVGVLKVLVDAGIPIDMIAGTSIGAIVGGLYDGGVSVARLEEQTRDNSIMRAFMNVPLKIRILTTPIHMLPRLFGQKSFDGLYSGSKFREYLKKQLPDPDQDIENLKLPYCAVALSLIDGHLHSFTSGNLVHAMMASSALPELRKPSLIENNLYVDGGVFSNVPVDQARSVLGADFLIAVDIDERFDDASVDSFKKLGSVGSRLVKIELVRNDYPELMKADVVIHPNVDGIGLISRSKKDANRGVDAGIAAAQDALPAIIKALKDRGIDIKSVGH
jgi:NTE family protein